MYDSIYTKIETTIIRMAAAHQGRKLTCRREYIGTSGVRKTFCILTRVVTLSLPKLNECILKKICAFLLGKYYLDLKDGQLKNALLSICHVLKFNQYRFISPIIKLEKFTEKNFIHEAN